MYKGIVFIIMKIQIFVQTGFYDIIPKELISIFSEQELELLISGLPTFDIDDLRQNTDYHKYQANSPQVRVYDRKMEHIIDTLLK